LVNDTARENASLGWLLALSIALFAIAHPALLGVLLAAQLALWIGSGLAVRELWQPLRRLLVFGLLIALSFAFVTTGGADRWLALPGPDWLRVNLDGLALAGVMFLRVLTLVLASAWVQRSCAPGALVRGLRRLRMPETVAIAVDATLGMLAGGPGSGTGGGGGTGGGRNRESPADGRSWAGPTSAPAACKPSPRHSSAASNAGAAGWRSATPRLRPSACATCRWCWRCA
jgi:hypothetical protein